MRIIIFAVLAALAMPMPAAAGPTPERVLLIGNSIIYTNNLPAVLRETTHAASRDIEIDMFARGGAQIVDLVNSRIVEEALDDGGYDVVIFHDRGGDAMCANDEDERKTETCQAMIDNHSLLAERVRAAGARPYLLGTYQPPHASKRLTAGEQFISTRIGVPYIEISDTWNRIREQHPEMPWFAEDGLHPGRALTTLMALRIHQALFNELPPITNYLSTTAPLYVPRDAMTGIVRHGSLENTAVQEILSKEEVSVIAAMLKE